MGAGWVAEALGAKGARDGPEQTPPQGRGHRMQRLCSRRRRCSVRPPAPPHRSAPVQSHHRPGPGYRCGGRRFHTCGRRTPHCTHTPLRQCRTCHALHKPPRAPTGSAHCTWRGRSHRYRHRGRTGGSGRGPSTAPPHPRGTPGRSQPPSIQRGTPHRWRALDRCRPGRRCRARIHTGHRCTCRGHCRAPPSGGQRGTRGCSGPQRIPARTLCSQDQPKTHRPGRRGTRTGPTRRGSCRGRCRADRQPAPGTK